MQFPPKASSPRRHTLSDVVCNFRSKALQLDLENFRIEYEKTNGPTDLTKRYSSTLPSEMQEWLLSEYPERYWDGLPQFAQAFFMERLRNAANLGELDTLPSHLLRMYISKRRENGR